MSSQLLRSSLRLGLSALITASIALWCQRIEFAWYPLLAVIFVVDDNDESTLKAAGSRIFGTATGGLVAFLVHMVCQGWAAVLISLLISVPLLRLLGWQGGLSTAATITILFLLIPHYSALDWAYVFNRTLDTSVGILLAIASSLLFWPRNRLAQIQRLDLRLHAMVSERELAWCQWLNGEGPRPAPAQAAQATGSLLDLERLVRIERSGHARRAIRRGRWDQRLLLWQSVHHHWFQLERLRQRLNSPEQAPVRLLKLALEEEEKRLNLVRRAQRLCETSQRREHPQSAPP